MENNFQEEKTSVKELIEKLEKIEDKEQDVIGGEWNLVSGVYQY